MNNMSNRNYCRSNRFSQNSRLNNSTNEHDRYKLPAINNGTALVPNINSSSMARPCPTQPNHNYSTEFSNLNNTHYNTANANRGSAIYNTSTPLHSNDKTNCVPHGVASSQTFSMAPPASGMYNSTQPVPANRSWSSNQFVPFDKMNTTDVDLNKNSLINPNGHPSKRPMTSGPNGFNRCSSNRNIPNGQKTILRDRHLANEILQKAGIPSSSAPNDCLEIIADTPVTMNEDVICDPNPLCMKKPVASPEYYEQSIFVRHLQVPRPSAPPPPIIIREHCTQPIPPPPCPIVIRQIPARPSTPSPLIIRECPPPMLDLQEPTIIEREVPPPPPPPRQVIVERLPAPPPKPRSIILEKWLPYEDPPDRPCIVEKVAINDMPPPKNVIIQYEAVQPKIQPKCINEGISYVDPKQFVNDKPNGNVEVCYVDHLNNLPEHIKCQLSPEVLAAIGIQNYVGPNNDTNPYPIRSNSTAFHQQHARGPSTSTPMMPRHAMMNNGCHSAKPSHAQLGRPNMYHSQQQPTNRALFASGVGAPHCYEKYKTNMFPRSDHQGFNNLSRAHYNPWATTYQVSYSNKTRGMCRAR